ncbi:helix-turn-helix domain-containing protein [Nocardia anaemiae]|uniref:helix-turn-helix domain-containing protein n=1 Tax=Nocardia anaemiae TaxID=263910 RepID=UPI0012F51658
MIDSPLAHRFVHTIDSGGRSRQRWTELAAHICEKDTAHRRDPAEVVQILALSHDNGWNITRIAREINRSRSTVSGIISQAAEIQHDRSGTRHPPDDKPLPSGRRAHLLRPHPVVAPKATTAGDPRREHVPGSYADRSWRRQIERPEMPISVHARRVRGTSSLTVKPLILMSVGAFEP